jgi:hypothetical protein
MWPFVYQFSKLFVLIWACSCEQQSVDLSGLFVSYSWPPASSPMDSFLIILTQNPPPADLLSLHTYVTYLRATITTRFPITYADSNTYTVSSYLRALLGIASGLLVVVTYSQNLPCQLPQKLLSVVTRASPVSCYLLSGPPAGPTQASPNSLMLVT